MRQARKISPTNYYHIMMRGNNREKIFTRQEQKLYFIDLLKKIMDEEPIEAAAYCLMDNHAHIVVNGKITDLSKAIKRLNIKYAMKFNKEADRIGHVFQDRFRSEVIFDEPYLVQVIRYVHNNPVKAGMVDKPEDYRWSSYCEYIKRKENIINPEQMDFIMKLLSDKLDLFKKFHNQEDHREYLDTQEEINRNRNQMAQKIIANYCSSKRVSGDEQILSNPETAKELIQELLTKTHLSHRQIARILKISNNVVHKVSLKSKSK